ncbi:putative N-acetyl-gamma-glutamyl-phosphate reductase, chloroplastic [Gossypium australe]|uniref:Putative N-acetyl-gamma-glutamyl-phosphate reductase, chloroplastic n=1 Tax=Gossypium australe TaxID=47621 RepID=A0A5B6WLQ5_9ROSI|nr:putative N-acetyl-gamma-glutamyl-phosphate reductase, chloroplastic [Gossypium australe]
MHKLLEQHFKVVKRILSYLQGTLDYGVTFKVTFRLSLMGGNQMLWCSKKQQGLAHATTEIIWLESLLGELQVSVGGQDAIWCDHSEAIAISTNHVLHFEFKYPELDLFFIEEKTVGTKLMVGHVPAQDQVADVFTKPLPSVFFNKFRFSLGVVSKYKQQQQEVQDQSCQENQEIGEYQGMEM